MLHLSLTTKVLAPGPPGAASVLVCEPLPLLLPHPLVSLLAWLWVDPAWRVDERPEDGTRAARAAGAQEATPAGPGASALGDESCLLGRARSERWEDSRREGGPARPPGGSGFVQRGPGERSGSSPNPPSRGQRAALAWWLWAGAAQAPPGLEAPSGEPTPQSGKGAPTAAAASLGRRRSEVQRSHRNCLSRPPREARGGRSRCDSSPRPAEAGSTRRRLGRVVLSAAPVFSTNTFQGQEGT